MVSAQRVPVLILKKRDNIFLFVFLKLEMTQCPTHARNICSGCVCVFPLSVCPPRLSSRSILPSGDITVCDITTAQS